MAESKLKFVIGGAQKGGTTTLDSIFRRHPAIQMARIKETHFFDDESRNWEAPDYRGLDTWFQHDAPRLRGEATPITLYWRPAIRRLHAYNPDVRLVFLLRNPIERAFSNWRKEYSRGKERATFGEAIRGGRTRVREQAEVEGLHRLFSYVERGLYGEQLAFVLKFFPREQVHCEVSEEFFEDPGGTLRRLTAFLGIAPFPDDLPLIYENRGRPFAYPSTLTTADATYLAALFEEDIHRLESLIGRSIPRWYTRG